VPPDRFANPTLAASEDQFETDVDGTSSLHDDRGTAIRNVRHHTGSIRNTGLYERGWDASRTRDGALKVLSGNLHA
jgi:hypothetical protein